MFPALKRIFFEITECQTQTQMADLLKIRQSSVADVKKRKSIPSDWLIKLLRLKSVNPEWVPTGAGCKYLKPSEYEPPEHPHVAYLIERRPPENCPSEELFNELVRRALKSPDLKEFRKQVEATWLPVKKLSEDI